MEKNKKELKFFSFLVLIFVAFSVINNVLSICLHGLDIPVVEGISKDVLQTAAIIIVVIGFIVLLPQVYIGVKGIMIANGAPSGKAHIVWGIILAVYAAISVVSSIAGLAKFNMNAVLDLLGPVIDLALYVFYVIYACKVAKE